MRMINKPENRKISYTLSLPLWLITLFDKLKNESPGFDKNKFIIDIMKKYFTERGDYEEQTIE